MKKKPKNYDKNSDFRSDKLSIKVQLTKNPTNRREKKIHIGSINIFLFKHIVSRNTCKYIPTNRILIYEKFGY